MSTGTERSIRIIKGKEVLSLVRARLREQRPEAPESARDWYATIMLGEADPYPTDEAGKDAFRQRVLADLDRRFGPGAVPRLRVYEDIVDDTPCVGARYIVEVPADSDDWRLYLRREPDRLVRMLCDHDAWAIDRQVIIRALEFYQADLRRRTTKRYDDTEIEKSLVAHCLLEIDEVAG